MYVAAFVDYITATGHKLCAVAILKSMLYPVLYR